MDHPFRFSVYFCYFRMKIGGSRYFRFMKALPLPSAFIHQNCQIWLPKVAGLLTKSATFAQQNLCFCSAKPMVLFSKAGLFASQRVKLTTNSRAINVYSRSCRVYIRLAVLGRIWLLSIRLSGNSSELEAMRKETEDIVRNRAVLM